MVSTRSSLLSLLLVLFLFLSTAFPAFAQGNEENQLFADAEWLVVPHVSGEGGLTGASPFARSYLFPDNPAVPGEGQPIPGTDATWQSARAEDGSLEHDSLQNGYAYLQIESRSERILMSRIANNYRIHLNGATLAGDIYGNRQGPIPLHLKEGTNHLFVRGIRGGFSYEFSEPEQEITVSDVDTTLPDIRRGMEFNQVPAGLIFANTSTDPVEQLDVHISGEGPVRDVTRTKEIYMPPGTMNKIPVRLSLEEPVTSSDRDELTVTVEASAGDRTGSQSYTLRVRDRNQTYDETFISPVDRSVQYYGVHPPANVKEREKNRPMSLVLSLHGASVEASGLTGSYTAKKDTLIVTPTNRRPYGFDWEDWGRRNALHTMEVVMDRYNINPNRVYLTGHSMGGHGVYHVGAAYPDRFAALGPSAGWSTLWSYGSRSRPGRDGPTKYFHRGMGPSDTFSLMENYSSLPMFIIHGTEDENVPISQSEEIVEELESFHNHYVFHREEGAEHWWDRDGHPGTACVNLVDMFEYFRSHKRNPRPKTLHFATWNPSITGSHYWVTVHRQPTLLDRSEVEARAIPEMDRINVETENVSRLSITPEPHFSRGPITLKVNGTEKELEWNGNNRISVDIGEDSWERVDRAVKAGSKNTERYGPFKEAFDGAFVLVYGTGGTEAENRAARRRAYADAQVWWYRGNGRGDLVPDSTFDPDAYEGQNVILYGHADMNSAFDKVVSDPSVHVERNRFRVGNRTYEGAGHAGIYLQPRANSKKNTVAVVGGTGAEAIRSTIIVRYIRSGLQYPDVFVYGFNTDPSWQKRSISANSIGLLGSQWGTEDAEIWHRSRQQEERSGANQENENQGENQSGGEENENENREGNSGGE